MQRARQDPYGVMTMNNIKNAVRLSLLGGLAAGLLAMTPGTGNAAAGEPTVTRER